jgi:hypothetical protein
MAGGEGKGWEEARVIPLTRAFPRLVIIERGCLHGNGKGDSMRHDAYVSPGFDACAGCGQKVITGAMRCPRCGRLLISPEEQLERLTKLKERKKESHAGRILRALLWLLIIGTA